MDIDKIRKRIRSRDLSLLNESFLSEFIFENGNYALIHKLASEGWVEILSLRLSLVVLKILT